MQIYVLMEKSYEYNDNTYSESGGGSIVGAFLTQEEVEKEAQKRNKERIEYLFETNRFLDFFGEHGNFQKGFAKAIDRYRSHLEAKGKTDQEIEKELRSIQYHRDMETLLPLTEEEKEQVLAEYDPTPFYWKPTFLNSGYRDLAGTLLEDSDGKRIAA